MKCSSCQHENRVGAKFCDECATPLGRACTNCGTELSPTAKFCSECGHPAGQAAQSTSLSSPRFGAPETYTTRYLAEKILISRAALEGERKQVTVLFADHYAIPIQSSSVRGGRKGHGGKANKARTGRSKKASRSFVDGSLGAGARGYSALSVLGLESRT